MLSTYISIVIGTLAAGFYLACCYRPHLKTKVYLLNVATLVAFYLGLGADTILQLVNNAHLCSEKFFLTSKQGPTEVPCGKVTLSLIVADILFILVLPFVARMIRSLDRYCNDKQESDVTI